MSVSLVKSGIQAGAAVYTLDGEPGTALSAPYTSRFWGTRVKVNFCGDVDTVSPSDLWVMPIFDPFTEMCPINV